VRLGDLPEQPGERELVAVVGVLLIPQEHNPVRQQRRRNSATAPGARSPPILMPPMIAPSEPPTLVTSMCW
jgi:hypothetical protein